MSKRALLVGIDNYTDVSPLSGCVNDAVALRDVLERHEDGSPNFDVQLLVSPDPTNGGNAIGIGMLRERCESLFTFDGDVLFYFSGHGCNTRTGGYLVTQDGTPTNPGISMADLISWINSSRTTSALLILDCCFSGALGNQPNVQSIHGLEQAQLPRGTTILSASRPHELAMEVGGQGVFTDLVLGALEGGAADVRGRVSAASIYAYVEAALGAWDQRPLYKTHATSLPPVRLCAASVPDELLRELPTLFSTRRALVRLDPSFEETHHTSRTANVALFKKLKILRDARLLKTEAGDDLYYAALNSNAVLLTPLGEFYWRLAANGRI